MTPCIGSKYDNHYTTQTPNEYQSLNKFAVNACLMNEPYIRAKQYTKNNSTLYLIKTEKFCHMSDQSTDYKVYIH